MEGAGPLAELATTAAGHWWGLPPTALLLPHASFADSYAPYATAAPMTGSLANRVRGRTVPLPRYHVPYRSGKNKLPQYAGQARQDEDCLSSQVPAGDDCSDVPKCGGISYHL